MPPRKFWKLAYGMCRRMRGHDFLKHARRRWPDMSPERYVACSDALFFWDHARMVAAYPNIFGDALMKARLSRPHAARMLRVIRGRETLRPWETPDLAFSDPRLSRFLPDPQARRAAA